MIKNWGHKFVFELQALKAKIKGVLTGYTVAMVTFYVNKLTTTCSTMIGHSFNTISVASTDKEK